MIHGKSKKTHEHIFICQRCWKFQSCCHKWINKINVNCLPIPFFFIPTYSLLVGSIFSIFGLLVQQKPEKPQSWYQNVILLYIDHFTVNNGEQESTALYSCFKKKNHRPVKLASRHRKFPMIMYQYLLQLIAISFRNNSL